MQKRPWGVTFVSSFMIVVGGFSTVIIFVYILDSLRIYGVSSLMITGPMSLAGFILYGIMPVLFYSAGVSLYMARPWARRATVTIIPLAGFFWFFNWKYRSILGQSMLLNPGVLDILREWPGYFFQSFLQYMLGWALLVSYFLKPHVKVYFSSEVPSSDPGNFP
ncbi:MAG TPA: hypothetical protein PLT76_05580 [Candidatus Omnitrophota bacterium]|nr:hypothetical protein [Candidatus Omnitrophota bacterium]HQO58174.1 hypothetical protein [Candidatus Omnitrophota bacterium]